MENQEPTLEDTRRKLVALKEAMEETRNQIEDIHYILDKNLYAIPVRVRKTEATPQSVENIRFDMYAFVSKCEIINRNMQAQIRCLENKIRNLKQSGEIKIKAL